jgi:fibronectin type 3 domain-containing protein
MKVCFIVVSSFRAIEGLGAARRKQTARHGTMIFAALLTALAVHIAAYSGSGSNTTSISVPPAPTNLTANAVNAQVALSWSSSSGASLYNIYRSTTSGGEGSAAYVTGT